MKKLIVLIIFGLSVAIAPMAFAANYDLSTIPPAQPGYEVAVPGQIAGNGTGTSYWQIIDTKPTGTGSFEPFLRFGDNPNQVVFPPMETGLNTNATNPGVYDDKASIWTHAVPFANLTTVTNPAGIPAGTYNSFTLDFNEPGSATRFLSADTFNLYYGTNATISNIADPHLHLLYTGILSGDHVLMDYTIASSGSGEADIQVFVPSSILAGHAGKYFYLYSQMGGAGVVDGKNFGITDGYEEWRALVGTPVVPPVPEPSTLLLLGSGSGLLGLWGFRRKFKK